MRALAILFILIRILPARDIVVHPQEYPGAFKNPLKGFRPGLGRERTHEYASMVKHYIRWNEIENSEADGVDKIRAFSDQKWKTLPANNTKVIPRVFLDYPKVGQFWPADLETGDYTSERFQARMVRMIRKMGEAWDDDPRVAFIEMGIVGQWGEHHSPSLKRDMQKLMGDAFTAAFPHKLVLARYPKNFQQYKFGIYWDSFGHKEEWAAHVPLLEDGPLRDRWKIAPMGGETAFDWGTKLGENPTDAVVHNSKAIIELIRRLHWNHLGWLSEYDAKNPEAVRNAAQIQKAFGYRFVLDEVRYSAGKSLKIAWTGRNTGSSPFYYAWPLEISLLDPATRQPVWKQIATGVDIRTWMPGEKFSGTSVFPLPKDLKKGTYVLALAILDPAGRQPSARFAITNYYNGGRHPIGRIAIGSKAIEPAIRDFDDLASDKSLRYTR